MFVRFLFIFYFLFILLRKGWWPSIGKERSSWLSDRAVLFYAVFIVCVTFPFGVWGSLISTFVVRYLDSMIPLVSIFKIQDSSLS